MGPLLLRMIWQRWKFYQIPPKKRQGSTVSVHPEDNSGTDCKRGAPSVRGQGPFAQLSRRSGSARALGSHSHSNLVERMAMGAAQGGTTSGSLST